MKPINSIAIIEDDEITQYLTSKSVEDSNLVHKINVFGNGREAIDYFSSYSGNENLLPDIILLDLNMPIMDGWEFIEEFTKFQRHIEKKIAVFVVTSSVSYLDSNRIKRISEVFDCIIKPVTKEKFEGIVKMVEEKQNSLALK